MKIITIIAVVVLIAAVAALLIARFRTRQAPARVNVAQDLRKEVLKSTPETMGFPVEPGEPYVVVMDLARPEAVASVFAALTGDASIYFSNGGGIIGGIGHETVRDAAISFVRAARDHARTFSSTSEFEYPTAGRVRFYVRTPEGVLTADALEEDLAEGRHPLSSLFAAGHEVVTQLRLVSERAQ